VDTTTRGWYQSSYGDDAQDMSRKRQTTANRKENIIVIVVPFCGYILLMLVSTPKIPFDPLFAGG